MKFWEAMKALEEGKKVRSVEWGKHYFWHPKEEQPDCMWSDCRYRVNRMRADEWELYEEPEKIYSFMEIIPLLREGKKFRRKEWIEKKSIAFYNPAVYWNEEGGRALIMAPHLIEATDWVEVE